MQVNPLLSLYPNPRRYKSIVNYLLVQKGALVLTVANHVIVCVHLTTAIPDCTMRNIAGQQGRIDNKQSREG